MTKLAQRSGNEQKVKVDLNNPEFLKSWFTLKDRIEIARVLNTIEKALQLTWGQVYRDPGLKWEHITHLPVPLPDDIDVLCSCLLYTSPSPRDRQKSRMPSSA